MVRRRAAAGAEHAVQLLELEGGEPCAEMEDGAGVRGDVVISSCDSKREAVSEEHGATSLSVSAVFRRHRRL